GSGFLLAGSIGEGDSLVARYHRSIFLSRI
ncbi:MAG: hypothetical protein ACI8PG_005351, partial [Planctomycetota bacterium]